MFGELLLVCLKPASCFFFQLAWVWIGSRDPEYVCVLLVLGLPFAYGYRSLCVVYFVIIHGLMCYYSRTSWDGPERFDMSRAVERLQRIIINSDVCNTPKCMKACIARTNTQSRAISVDQCCFCIDERHQTPV